MGIVSEGSDVDQAHASVVKDVPSSISQNFWSSVIAFEEESLAKEVKYLLDAIVLYVG